MSPILNNVIILCVLALGIFLAVKFSKKSSSANQNPDNAIKTEKHKGIEVEIIEYVDDSQPGFVRCTFTDAFGKEWFITEKVPVVSKKNLDKDSEYPTTGFVAAEIRKSFIDHNGREVVTIDIDKPWAVSDESDETVFFVLKEKIVEA